MAASRVHPDENGSLTLSIRSADIYQFAKDTDHLSLAYALLPGKCRQRSQRTWGGLPLLPQAQSIARYGYVMSTARLTSSSTAPAKNLEARSVTRCGVVPAAASLCRRGPTANCQSRITATPLRQDLNLESRCRGCYRRALRTIPAAVPPQFPPRASISTLDLRHPRDGSAVDCVWKACSCASAAVAIT
jgi:hypothetical protein